MDGNLWAGENIIKGDMKMQNQNGKMFEMFLTQNSHLSVVNALDICEGKFTHVKVTKDVTTKTILDFFLVCDKILPHVTKMKIDEKGENALTRYKNYIVKSDHNMLTLEINLTFHNEKSHERTEMFSFKNKKSQVLFKEYTTNTTIFTKCFLTDENINLQFEKWKKRLQKSFHACFRRIRVGDNKKKLSFMDHLMNEKKEIVKSRHPNKEQLDRLENINEQIKDECENMEWEKLVNTLGSLETVDGHTNNTNIWKQMRKAFPQKTKTLPTGVKNTEEKIITNPNEKKKVFIDHFIHRMRKRPAEEDVKSVINTNEEVSISD